MTQQNQNEYWYTAVCIIVAVLIAGCTSTKVTGPGGSETVNTFAVVVVDEYKQPLQNASVRVVHDDLWLRKTIKSEDPSCYSTTSDKNGISSIPLDTLPDSKVNLIINSGIKGAFRAAYEFGKNNSSDQDTIVLRETASFSGRVNAAGAIVSRVVLQGTDFFSDVDSVSGEFSFPILPPGTYNVLTVKATADTVRKEIAGADSIDLSEGEKLLTELQSDFTGVLIDDFEGQSNLMSYLKYGSWYIVKDPGTIVSFPVERLLDTSYVSVTHALITTGAHNGNSLRINYTAASSGYFLIIGAGISTTEAGLVSADTVSFWAKGNGSLKIRLHGNENYLPEATCTIALDTQWQKHVITSNMYFISDPVNTQATWQEVEQRLCWIAFHPGAEGTEFWLDDVRLDGVNLRDLVGQ